LLGGLGAGLAVMMMIAAWQLSSGPISLAFLSPYIEDILNTGQQKFKLKMKDTILTWAGWERALDIRVLEVKVLRPDGELVGSIPEVSFSLSGQALVNGIYAPRSIELFGPRIRIIRTFDGDVDIGFMDTQKKSADLTGLLFDQLQAAPDPNNAMSYLARLEVVNGEVTLDDQLLGKTWVTPSAHVSLRRDSAGIKGQFNLELDVDKRQTEIAGSGVYQTALKRFDLTVNFSEVSPVAFSSIYYELGPLRALALPLKGTITAGVTLGGKIEWAGFNLTGGKGIINLPGPVRQTLGVEKVVLRGRYEGEENSLDIDELSLTMGAKGHLLLPAPANHPVPLASLSLKGKFLGQTQRLEITEAIADLQGPELNFTATLDGFPGFTEFDGETEMSIDLKGGIKDVPVDHLKKYWPRAWGTSAYDWLVPNLSAGVVHQARAEMQLWGEGVKGFELVSLDGDMDVSGVTVDYLNPMPKVQNTDAYMKFDEKNFNIFISKADSENLSVREGSVLISGLDEVDQFADITLLIDGSFPDKLAYLNHEPLGYAKTIGIDPKSTKGSAETTLKLNFLMEKALTLDGIKVVGKTKASGVSAAKVLLGRDINGAELDIRVDKKGMDLSGTVRVGKIPAALVWRENFGDKGPFKRRYDLKAQIADARQVAELGLDVAPFTDKFVKGSVEADVRFTLLDNINRRLEIKTDITNAELSTPAFGWKKDAGVPGQAQIIVDLDGDTIRDVPGFSVIGDKFAITGKAKYGKEGQDGKGGKTAGGLHRIDFERISFGRNELQGALISRPEGGWDAGFHGPSFDMTAIWNDIFSNQLNDQGADGIKLPYITVAVELENVWIGPERNLKNISGTFAHQDDIWKTVLVKGDIGDKKSFELTIRPSLDGNRDFVLTSADAGETLKAMDFYDNMIGGELEIIGKYDDAASGQPLKGRLKAKDYRIGKAPALAHVLSLMALTGILEALQGDGLSFNSLDIPFVLGQGALEIKNANASGPSLGFTASGTIYTYADVVDITGTVIPAYAINSALGHIPVLGKIFTGGEKGGGVFAANYTMSGPVSKPEVFVNPLSALTPGIFRNVFDIFGKQNEGGLNANP